MRKMFKTILIVFISAMPTFLHAQVVSDKSFTTFYPKTEILHNRAFLEAGNHALPITLEQRISGLSVGGRKVYQQAASQSYGTLKLNGLAQGIYILKVRMDNEDMVVKKIVKQ